MQRMSRFCDPAIGAVGRSGVINKSIVWYPEGLFPQDVVTDSVQRRDLRRGCQELIVSPGGWVVLERWEREGLAGAGIKRQELYGREIGGLRIVEEVDQAWLDGGHLQAMASERRALDRRGEPGAWGTRRDMRKRRDEAEVNLRR